MTPLESFTTACPRNCYSTCTMRVEIEDGRLRRVEPHGGNRATPEGACLKGLSYVERQHAADRLLHPLRRVPGSRRFEKVDWETALDTIAGHLIRLRRRHGARSVFYYAASGTKGLLNAVGMDFWRLYGGCTTTFGDLCWPAGLEATRLTLGENKHSAPWEIARARSIVFWGKNPAETNIHQMVFVQQALEAGGRLTVIDPRRTETAERAHLLIQPRPGSDGALALAVARALIRSGRIDRPFIDRHVLGFERFAEMVEAYTAERAAEICDIAPQAIERLADAIGGAGPVSICAGYGMQRYTNSGQTLRAILALLAVTGNIGRPGAGWWFANLQSAIFDEVKDPLAFYPPSEPDGVVRISISTARLGRDMLATADPPLRMAWIERGNPVTQNPETLAVLEAFRRLEFRVVVDQFMTDTAREADLVLPAKTMFEQTDVIGAYWHPYIQIKQKVLEPAGEVRPESEIYRGLAERLGLPPDEVDRRIPGPGDAQIEAFLERKLRPFPELSLARLRQGPALAPGHQEVAFADLVFATPSGRIELFSEEARRRWGVGALPEFEEPEESIARPAAGSRRYPLHFMTPNTKNRIHSQFNNLPMIRKLSPGPFVQIHPDDARARGLADGSAARIFNDRGELRVPVRLDWGIKRGCVAVTNGWWSDDGGSVNVCSKGRETDIGHGAAFHDNLVDVEPV